MLQPNTQPAVPSALRNSPATAAATPVVMPATPVTSTPFQPDKVRHLMFGTLVGVQATIKELHQRGYAEPNDWSRLLPTRPGEVMVVLTRRVEEPSVKILRPREKDFEPGKFSPIEIISPHQRFFSHGSPISIPIFDGPIRSSIEVGMLSDDPDHSIL